jgi:hypothetical protein
MNNASHPRDGFHVSICVMGRLLTLPFSPSERATGDKPPQRAGHFAGLLRQPKHGLHAQPPIPRQPWTWLGVSATSHSQGGRE